MISCQISIYISKVIFLNLQTYPKISQGILPFSPSLSCRFATAAGIGLTVGARLDDPSGSLHAHVWPQGTTFGRARPPLRQVRLECPRSQAGLPQPLGCCHGPKAWLSSTRPVWRPGRRVSASGDCFWRRCTSAAPLSDSQNQ